MSCVEIARKRIEMAFDMSDYQIVAFSGGKDSTVLLNLCLEEAHRRHICPLDVLFVDEEAVAPPTIEYMHRIRERPDVNLLWSCVPTKHRNACSRKEPWWLTWDPAREADWCRPRPTCAGVLTAENRPDIPHDISIAEQMPYFVPTSKGTSCQFLGRRCSESLTRHRMITRRRGIQSFIAPNGFHKSMYTADPIYDMQDHDVWLAALEHGWDYNQAYDAFNKLGISVFKARIAPPYGEEPSENLWMWAQAWPELWDRMQSRVAGADSGARYSRSPLYLKTGNFGPSKGETWKEYTHRLLGLWPETHRAVVTANVRKLLTHHRNTCIRKLGFVEPMHETEKHDLSGMSWKVVAMVAGKGVLKGRSLAQRTAVPDAKKIKTRVFDGHAPKKATVRPR